jgi:diacylglycerol kinase (ATP)
MSENQPDWQISCARWQPGSARTVGYRAHMTRGQPSRRRRATSRGALARLARSFGFASRGIWVASSGPNVRIQLVAAAAVIFLVAAYGITGERLAVVVVSIVAVIAAEIINTAIERLCDLIAELHGLGLDPRIRDIKDLAAGAVLVVAIGAAVNGVIAFGPLLVP